MAPHIQVPLSWHLSPQLLTFSFPLLHCLPFCATSLPFSLSPLGKKPTPQMQTQHKIATYGLLQLQGKCRWCLNSSVLWSEITFPPWAKSGESVSSGLRLSSLSFPLGAEAAESVLNEVSQDACFSELETGLKQPEIALLGPFSCQQHNIGSLRCRMYSNKGG